MCRVQNLLPDTCNLCKQNYCVKIGDKPILSCARCGQGCHNSCVLQLIGKTEDDLNESNNLGNGLVNPYATLGLFYVCAGCQGETIPNKDSLKIRQGQGSRRTSLSGDPTLGTQQNNAVHPEAIDSSLAIIQTQSNTPAIDETHSTHQVEPQVRNGPNTSSNSQAPSSAIPICKHYKTGRCKFGISGKKGGTCPKRHPNACTKFLTNGNRSRGGCTKGTNCNLFHPSMCHASMKDRKCLREDCKFMHIRGTKRSENEVVDKQITAPPAAQQVQTENVRNVSSTNSNPNSNTTFLEMMKTMQDQISHMASKLEQVDANYRSLCCQQLGYPPQLRYPYPMQLHPQMKPSAGQPAMGSIPYHNQTVNSLGLQPAH